MRTWRNEAIVTATTDQVFADANEHVIATLSGVSAQSADMVVNLNGFCQVTTAAGDTTITLRVRRGTTVAGTLVGEANAENLSAAAGSTEGHSYVCTDQPGEVAGQSYVLTAQVDNAAGFTCAYSALRGTF